MVKLLIRRRNCIKSIGIMCIKLSTGVEYMRYMSKCFSTLSLCNGTCRTAFLFSGPRKRVNTDLCLQKKERKNMINKNAVIVGYYYL